jgi:hypothetical protein
MFFAFLMIAGVVFCAQIALALAWFGVSWINARRAVSLRVVNTSLSGTLFF